MSLPWVRLDTGFGDNPKVLDLIDDGKYRAVMAYLLGLCYCGKHELDGYIPKVALKHALHATAADASALVDARLWVEADGGWTVNGWADFQISSEEAQRRRQNAQTKSRKGNCVKYHGPDCGCWKEPT